MFWNQFGDFIDLDPDPDLDPASDSVYQNFVDPDQDPDTINPDPHHWILSNKNPDKTVDVMCFEHFWPSVYCVNLFLCIFLEIASILFFSEIFYIHIIYVNNSWKNCEEEKIVQ